MEKLCPKLAKAIHLFSPKEGLHESPVPGVHCVKYSKTDRRMKRHWRARFAIVAQGCKEIVLGHEVYRCDEAHYTVTPIDLPVISSIASASLEKPFLGLLIDLEPLTLSEVTAQLEKEFLKETENPQRAMFTEIANNKILEATIRLVKLFQTPEDAPVLGQLVIKEILFHLLKGAEGLAIRQFVRSGSKMHRISQVIHALSSDLSEEVDISALAKAANMSRSAFFKHFKEATAVSPIQYQKRLRLLKARRLMTEEGETAEGAAFKVGYNSASQFSREYSRMFGNSPLRDALKASVIG